jgi:hypothetical protein
MASKKTNPNLSLNATAPAQTLNYETQRQIERPDELAIAITNSQILRARIFARQSSFLTSYLPTKRSIYNYGFQVCPVDDANQDSIDEWLAEVAPPYVDQYVDPQTSETIAVESNVSNDGRIKKFVDDSWDEFGLLDSAIGFWLDDRPAAVSLPIERCLYTDILGLEILRYTHGLTSKQIEILAPDQQTRFRERAAILVNPTFGEHFKVLKRGRLGDGLSVPRLFSALRLLGQVDSLEVGLSQMAFLTRRTVRRHKIGHEIRQGAHSGKPTHFWNKKRDATTHTMWDNAAGVGDVTTNFDHEIDFPFPDLKVFDSIAWKGSDHRLAQWGGPVAQMMAATGVLPYIGRLLKAAALDDRSKMGEYLTFILNAAFAPPAPITVGWSNLIFNEERLQAEMMKYGHIAGVVSSTTLQEEIGTQPGREERNKLRETQDPDAMAKYAPLFDASHGAFPALGMAAHVALPPVDGTTPNPTAPAPGAKKKPTPSKAKPTPAGSKKKAPAKNGRPSAVATGTPPAGSPPAI